MKSLVFLFFVASTLIATTTAFDFLANCYWGPGLTGKCQPKCAEDSYCSIVLCLGSESEGKHVCSCSKCNTNNHGHRTKKESSITDAKRFQKMAQFMDEMEKL
eukprot:TCONS_00061350-protein